MIPQQNKGNFWIDHQHGIQYLYNCGRCLMSSITKQDVTGFKGKVLVCGLGLGIVVKKLNAMDEVDEIIVVEKEQEIIDMVWPHLDVPKAVVGCDDIFDFLLGCGEYDYGYFDMWTEPTKEIIEKTKKSCEGKINNVYCWGEK